MGALSGNANHAIGQANCAAVREAVGLGYRTVPEVAGATGLSHTSASSHLSHGVMDGHLQRIRLYGRFQYVLVNNAGKQQTAFL